MNPTQPSNTSATSIYISNWKDMVGIWKASKLTQLDQTVAGPRLGELHYLRGSLDRRSVNQIVDYSGFFRDESNTTKFTQTEHFASEAWFENGDNNCGTLTANYLFFEGAPVQPRLQISRSFVAPPNQPFFVVRYSFTNPTAYTITYNVLDLLHVNNLDHSKQVHAWYDPSNNVMIADMTASGQLWLFLGSFQANDGHQAADGGDTNPSSTTVSGWVSFDANGTLKNNQDIQAGDVELSFNSRVTLARGQTVQIYFYIGIGETQVDTMSAISSARASPGESWFTTTAAAYKTWFANGNYGRRVNFQDTGINTMFDRALITIKNAQNPVSGSFVATTNPIAYGYKNWVRDSAVTAIAFDAAGHHAEAEKHWRWFASVQSDDGTWKTTYSTWDSKWVPFVEPEFDSIGTFIYGVYRHYSFTADSQFLNDLWPIVKKAADRIISNISENGFGRADYSIWEESKSLEHNSYTQAWYVVGLYSAQCLAEIRGDTSLSEWYAGGPASILTSLQRPCTWYPPGQWNPAGYYNRAVKSDNSLNQLVDSSSDVLISLGAVDFESQRSASHIQTVLLNCTRQDYGLARYPGDMFYYTGDWSPGGNEALGPEPSWPQMTLWVAIYELLKGDKETALKRMQWFVSISGKGYMPSGEAVSNVTRQPLPSSMCEPLTASAFIISALMYEGQYQPGVIPPIYNAGAFKSMTISQGATDTSEWSDVPYFRGRQTPSSAPTQFVIKRVYVCNDHSNLYIRVDNIAGNLPVFDGQPLFKISIYSQDFSNGHIGVSNLGPSGDPIRRPMTYMVERSSNSGMFQRWSVSSDVWSSLGTIEGVVLPQWEPSVGKIELTIPVASLASAGLWFGNAWADLSVVLAYYDPSSNQWRDGDAMLLHYRLSKPDQPWTYGDIEQ